MAEAQVEKRDAENAMTVLETIVHYAEQSSFPSDPFTGQLSMDLVPGLDATPDKVKSKLEKLTRSLFEWQERARSRMAVFMEQTRRIAAFLSREDIEPEIRSEAETLHSQSQGLEM
jgi:hypothetical protein